MSIKRTAALRATRPASAGPKVPAAKKPPKHMSTRNANPPRKPRKR